MGVKEKEIEPHLLQKGDLLVVEGNGSLDQIGRVAIWDGSIPNCIHQNHLIKIRFNPTEIGRYITLWLLSPDGRRFITSISRTTSGLYTLSISKVSSLPVPLPSLDEQRKIVEEVESKISVIDTVMRETANIILQTHIFRNSILNMAYHGKLVPQDPDEEPASVILEKIKAKKSVNGKLTGRSKKVKIMSVFK